MSLFELLMLLLVGVLFLALLTTLILVVRQHSADLKAQTAASLKLQEHQLDMVNSYVQMIRAADPWQYQMITAAGQPYVYDESYDPSPEAEARRIAERDGTVEDLDGELNADERAALSDVFPGL